jgi:hypothetical protein
MVFAKDESGGGTFGFIDISIMAEILKNNTPETFHKAQKVFVRY